MVNKQSDNSRRNKRGNDSVRNIVPEFFTKPGFYIHSALPPKVFDYPALVAQRPVQSFMMHLEESGDALPVFALIEQLAGVGHLLRR